MPRRRLRFGPVGADHGAKVRGGVGSFQRGGLLKEATRGFIQTHRKLKISQTRQPLRQMVDGIIAFYRTRTVAAFALYFQAKVNIVLLAGLQTQKQAFAVLGFKVASISVNAVFSLDQVAMVL